MLSFFNCFAASAITLQFHCLNFSIYVMSNGNSRVRVVPLSLSSDQAFKIRLLLSFIDLESELETPASGIRASGSQRVRSASLTSAHAQDRQGTILAVYGNSLHAFKTDVILRIVLS